MNRVVTSSIFVLSSNVGIRQQQQHWPTLWNNTAVETKLESSHWNKMTPAVCHACSTVITAFRRHSSSIRACQCNKRVSSRKTLLFKIHASKVSKTWFLKFRLISKPFLVGSRYRVSALIMKKKQVVFHHRDGIGSSFFFSWIIDSLQIAHVRRSCRYCQTCMAQKSA